MQETEEITTVFLDIQNENEKNESDSDVNGPAKRTKKNAKIKKTISQSFFFKRIINGVKGKLLEWWDILGEDEYDKY